VAAGWFWGRGLHVRLGPGGVEEARVVEVPRPWYRALLGGRGLAVALWASLVDWRGPPGPLEPGNPLVIAPGALVGSPLSTASKTAFAARSPLTGLLGRAMAGARLGWELRRLGYDFLAVSGALEEPGVLVLDPDGVRVEEARGLWGLRVGEARAELGRRYRGYADAVIGPAGENLSAIAMIDANGRQAGRTGLGAVMGSKRLKAIVARGGLRPEPADPLEARRVASELNRLTHGHPASRGLVEYGTPLMAEYTDRLGVLPSLNWRRSTLSWCPGPEPAARIARYAGRARVGRNPCPFCGRPCSQVVEAGGGRVDGPEYETTYALGSDIGVCDPEAVARLNLLADELGFDTISAGATIAWAMEAGERGLLEGAPRWGDVEAVARLLEDMAQRRGRLGGLLADGVRRAAERLGAGWEFALHVKGLEPPAYDARGLKGMALGYAVSSRGADHLTSGAYAAEIPGALWVYRGVDRLGYEGKPVMVRDLEDLMGFYDNTGICKFSRYTLHPENVAPLVEALTGEEWGPGDLLRTGEADVNAERLVNLALGLDPERDDTLPPRLTREPISDGPSRGELVPPDRLEWMVKTYYAARGWSPGGRPLRSTILRLGLDRVLPGRLLEEAHPGPGGG
jgi:aldehyde:ferredoxin oxidoreductase